MTDEGQAVEWASELWRDRVRDYKRHVADLRCRGYEGALNRQEKEVLFGHAFAITTPVSIGVLADVRDWYLCGEAVIETNPPADDGHGGSVASWAVSWPLLRHDRDRFTGGLLRPVTLAVVFPADWTHPHIALLQGPERAPAFAWPFQVSSVEDAARQENVLRAVAEAELHDRIFRAETNWAVLPQHFGSEG
jgi:hypothetical protein